MVSAVPVTDRPLVVVVPPTVSDSPSSSRSSSTGASANVAVPVISPASMVSATSATVP